jgi:chromosome segregation ATPase
MSTSQNLKKSSSNSISSRSQKSLASLKRSNDDLTQKLLAKDQEITKLCLKNQEDEMTAAQLRQQNNDLQQQLQNVKYEFDEKTEELERFRYINHLHRKNLLVQHRENLESLQTIIERKDREIELLKSRLHKIIRSKYTECENLRHQLDAFKRRVNQISNLNVNISEQIKLVKKKSVTFCRPEVLAKPSSGQSSEKTLTVQLTEKLENLLDNQGPTPSTEEVTIEMQSSSSDDPTQSRSISRVGVKTRPFSSSDGASTSKCNLLIFDSDNSEASVDREGSQETTIQISDEIENVKARDSLEKLEKDH